MIQVETRVIQPDSVVEQHPFQLCRKATSVANTLNALSADEVLRNLANLSFGNRRAVWSGNRTALRQSATAAKVCNNSTSDPLLIMDSHIRRPDSLPCEVRAIT